MKASRYSDEEAGRVLIPHAIDDLGRDEPDRILYEFPRHNDLTQGFQSVSAGVFANAINRAAWYLEDSLGKGVNFETLGYIGPGDLRYLILTVAAIKAGYKMLFTSPRNSLEGEIAVIEAAGCKTWLVPSKGSNINRVLAVHPLKTLELPDLDHFLDREPVPHYLYNKTWDVGRHEPCWVLHTSGSTGHPKPIVRNLASVSCFGANLLCQPIDGRPLIMKPYFETRVYITFPLFHAAGLNNSLLWPLFYGCTMVVGPELPVTIEVMKDVLRHAKPDGVFAAPSLLEDIALDEEFLNMLEDIKVIAFAGGPLSQQAGDIICKRTTLILSMGTTESGWHISVELDREDWNNIRFHPNTGFELQEVSPGLYELVAIRRPELERWQMIFETFPDAQEYHFKDLFAKHPTKKDLWHYQGRIDNIIVLSNGEKFNPTSMETQISGHPIVDSLIVAGQGRFQISLLVEPVRNAENAKKSNEEIITELWPTIEEANREAPSHAKLLRSHILVASPSKPFLRASKGTVRKVPTLQLYQDELDRLYAQADSDDDLENVESLDLTNEERLRSGIRDLVKPITKIEELGDDDDFFGAGVDSLQVITLQRQLRKALPANSNPRDYVKAPLIYQNATINLLSHAIWTLSSGQPNGVLNGISHTHKLQALIDRYTSDLPSRPHSKAGLVVILTGSTGSLGSYLLDTLIKLPSVSEIWCLNRSDDAEARQTASSGRRGLVTDWKSNNVYFRKADLSKENLNLSKEGYQYLLDRATNIIHTQWQVDFNLALPSFSKHIQGVRNLIDFSIASSRNTAIFFTSSVGVANNWKLSESIPEKQIVDLSVARTGYGESKLVAETVLLEAAKKSAVNVTIARVGQIAGPVENNAAKGMWNTKEWLPSIIDASARLSLLPRTLGKNTFIEWIPVDLLSQIIVQLAFSSGSDEKARVFHAVNPNKTTWDALLPTVLDQLSVTNNGKDIKTVSWEQWVNALSELAAISQEKEVSSLPALKLVDFFRSLSFNFEDKGKEHPFTFFPFETTATSAVSDVLRELPPVNKDWMRTWLQQWGY
ncbi:hypothetical protein F5884DRAFT_257643 [Xylogone sp. PMI_703]|nr:hypothetical protein F5884DRAFT_257643 [Xylogone sp. PMI_703]